MDRVRPTFHDFVSVMMNVIYYKIDNVKYENSHISSMFKEKKKCEDALTYLNLMGSNQGITNSSGEYSRNKWETIETIKVLERQIGDELCHLYNSYLNRFTEICTSHGPHHDGVYKLENGFVHSFTEPAYRSLTSDHVQYFIYGQMVSYNEWIRHPQVRKKKIDKICSKLETM